MEEMNKEKEREGSISSIDSETAFEDWMESRPRPEIKVSDDALLFQTLKGRKSPSLRDTLTKICQRIPSARKLAIEELLIYKDETLPDELDMEPLPDTPPDNNEAGDTSPENFEGGLKEIAWRQLNAATRRPWWKQKCPKYETCRRCGEEYETVYAPLFDNCNYHPGKRFVDKESWFWNFESWNSNPNGWKWLEAQTPKETMEFGWDIGFKWDCCNKSVAEYGTFCKQGRHIPKEAPVEKDFQGPSTAGSQVKTDREAKENSTKEEREKVPEETIAKQKLAENRTLDSQHISAWDGLLITRKDSGKVDKQLDNQQSDTQSDGANLVSTHVAGKRHRESEDGSRKVRPRHV